MMSMTRAKVQCKVAAARQLLSSQSTLAVSPTQAFPSAGEASQDKETMTETENRKTTIELRWESKESS